MKKTPTITTLGSHTALQILKGAHDEGFRTLIVATHNRTDFYRRFNFIDEFLTISSYKNIAETESILRKKNAVIIPHGSFVAYLGIAGNKEITLPYFGNKKVLDWEADRTRQLQWLKRANVLMPKEFSVNDNIDRPVIIKSHGAAGGSGYFIATNKKELLQKLKKFGKSDFIIQEYMIGVPVYIHYFYSPLTDTLEIMSVDRRYESNVDGIGRLPLSEQKILSIDPSFVVVGNSPLVIRESLLPEAYALGERIVATSKKIIDDRGIWGPFCLETIITPDQKFYAIEISCRIVAGTNLFINGSPYTDLTYNTPMSTGRRIAREIKTALKSGELTKILD